MSDRKRYLLVDTGSLVWAAAANPATVTDRAGAKLLLTPLADRFPPEQIWGDGGDK